MTPFSEQMDLRRRQILAGLIVGFATAQTMMILDRVFTPSGWVHITFIGIALLGWFFFGLEFFFMFRTGHVLQRKPDIERALNDEFVRQKRGRAAAAAFWVVMIFQTAILVLSLFFPLDAGIAAQATLTVGVVGLIGLFLFYDREDGDA